MDKFTVKVGTVEFPIVQHEVKKGKGKGNIKYRPDKSAITMQNLLSAFGEKKILDELSTRINALANGITEEALESSEGGKDETKFKLEYERMFSELSACGETMSTLQDRLEELVDELTSLDDKDENYVKNMIELSGRIKSVQSSIKNKKSTKTEASPAPTSGVPATVSA